MTNKRVPFTALMMCLLLLTSTFAVAGTPPPPPPPPSVTVADSTPNHSPITHWDQFLTGLNATIANPPVATDETTVNGPHFQWSCSNNPQFQMGVSDSSSDILASDPTLELAANDNNITVTCVVTWNVTDTKTNVVTPVTCSGSTNVTFFVKKPVQVIQLSNINHTNRANEPFPGVQSPYSQPGYYGHIQDYHLRLLDNQGQVYPKGSRREEFVQGSISEGPPPADDYMHGQPNGAAGLSSSFPGTNADFIDYIGFTSTNNLAALYGWNVTTLVIQFDQKWWCDEPTSHTTPLNTFHVQNDYQRATRN